MRPRTILGSLIVILSACCGPGILSACGSSGGDGGMLYAGTGETYFDSEIAQDAASLGGKILRMTPDGKPAPGNPFPDSVVWSHGHRNVQGLAWDAQRRM